MPPSLHAPTIVARITITPARLIRPNMLSPDNVVDLDLRIRVAQRSYHIVRLTECSHKWIYRKQILHRSVCEIAGMKNKRRFDPNDGHGPFNISSQEAVEELAKSLSIGTDSVRIFCSHAY